LAVAILVSWGEGSALKTTIAGSSMF